MLHLFCAATFKALLKSPDELSVISSYDGRYTFLPDTFTHTQVWLDQAWREEKTSLLSVINHCARRA